MDLGRVSQALQRLTSLGLAADTPAVKEALLAKFPALPMGARNIQRQSSPPPSLIAIGFFEGSPFLRRWGWAGP